MAHIINKLFRLISLVLLLSITIPTFAVKPLKDKEREKLTRIVKSRYEESMMQGAEVIKIGGKKMLVTIVGAKKGPNAQRVAQVKAARTAGEYLQAATNRSMTVYEVTDNSSYSLKERASEKGTTHNSVSSSEIDQKTDDFTTTETSEKFTDRIVQSSLTQVNYIQPLCSLGLSDGEQVFAYYMLMD